MTISHGAQIRRPRCGLYFLVKTRCCVNCWRPLTVLGKPALSEHALLPACEESLWKVSRELFDFGIPVCSGQSTEYLAACFHHKRTRKSHHGFVQEK